jgi:chromosome segregation ATPase
MISVRKFLKSLNPKAFRTGPKGGKFYESAGKKIYVKDENYRTPHAQAMAKKIKSLRSLDDITTSIFHIDKLVSEGKVLAEDVDSLYQTAERQMRSLTTQVDAYKDKKREERKERVTGERKRKEDIREERKTRSVKKYNEKIMSMRKRIDRWKNISKKLDELEHSTMVSKQKIDNKSSEIKEAYGKIKERGEQLKKYSQEITKNHPQYPKFIEAVKMYNTKLKNIKDQYSKFNTAKTDVYDRLSKIKSIKNKSSRIIKNYIKEASERKERLF